jgi:hypothetical protein
MTNETNEQRRRVSMTRKQEFAASSMLQQNLVKKENGLFQYLNGMNDARIAAIIDPSGQLRKSHIANLRKSLFGELHEYDTESRRVTIEKKKAGPNVFTKIMDKLDELSNRLDALEKVWK